MLKAENIVSTTCPYCGVGCNLQLHIEDGFIYRVTSPFDSVVNHGNLCVKGRFGYDYIYNKQRVTTPLIRNTRQKPGERSQAFDRSDGTKPAGMRRWTTPPTAWSKYTSAMAPKPWRYIAAPKPPMKTITCCKSCFARFSAQTM